MTGHTKQLISRILPFILRLLFSTIFVATFFILTQDIQIFPGIIPGFFSGPNSESSSIPANISSAFVTTTDGEQIETWHLKSEHERAIAIIFHGNADSLHTTYSIQRWLAHDGISSYSFDYRGYGRSSGFPNEEGIYRDADAVYELTAARNVPLLLIGISIGTGPATYLATRVKPEGLLLLSPYTSLTKVIQEIPLLGYLHPFLKYSFPTEEYMASVDCSCIVIAHGTKDSTIPVSHSRTLKQLYPDVQYLEIENAGHNTLLSIGKKEIKASLNACPAFEEKRDILSAEKLGSP